MPPKRNAAAHTNLPRPKSENGVPKSPPSSPFLGKRGSQGIVRKLPLLSRHHSLNASSSSIESESDDAPGALLPNMYNNSRSFTSRRLILRHHSSGGSSSTSSSDSPRPLLTRRISSFKSLAMKVSSLKRRHTSESFQQVATKVVSSQRAARGFKQMWVKDEPSAGGSPEALYHQTHGLHLEKKKLDLDKVVSEYKEVKRSQFYQELLVYIVFLFTFNTLLSWLPIQAAFEQSSVVRDLICTDTKAACDISSIQDTYDFARHVQDRVCNHTERWFRIGEVRLRQVRVKERRCDVTGTESSSGGDWTSACYPEFSLEAEDRSPILSPAKSRTTTNNNNPPSHNGSEEQQRRVYIWRDQLLDFQRWGHVFGDKIQDFGTGGFVVDLCQIPNVDALVQDEFISLGTRALSIEFTLVNPSTQIFTVGFHMFIITPSGHLKHYPHGANIRLTSTTEEVSTFTTSSSDKNVKQSSRYVRLIFFDIRTWLWILSFGFFLMYARGEYEEMSKMGFMSYCSSDHWNIFEMVQLLLLGTVLYFYLVYYYQSIVSLDALAKYPHARSSSFDNDDDDNASGWTTFHDTRHPYPENVNMTPILLTFQRLADYSSVTCALSLLKVFKFLRMNSTLNLLWQVLGMALKDLMGFLIIFNLIFVSYSIMGSLAFGFALEEYSTLAQSYGTCFQMLAGNFDYNALSRANPRIAPIFFGTFVVLVFQILVNMFVAILSEYYEVAKDNAAGLRGNLTSSSSHGNSGNNSSNVEDIEYDVIRRLRSYLESCAPTVLVLDTTEPLELVPGQTVRLISTNLVDQEVIRQRAKKVFRGAVWRVVALLRFGVKFDRKLVRPRRNSASMSRPGLASGHSTGPTTNTSHSNSNSNSANAKSNSNPKSKSTTTTHIRLSENFDHSTIKGMLPEGIAIRLEGDSLLGTDILLRVVRHSKISIECQVIGNHRTVNAVLQMRAHHHHHHHLSDDHEHPSTTNNHNHNLGTTTTTTNPRTTEEPGGAILEDVGDDPTSPQFIHYMMQMEDQQGPLELIGGESLRIPVQYFILHVGKTMLREFIDGFLKATKIWREASLIDDFHLSRVLAAAKDDGKLALRFDELYRLLDLFLRKDRRGRAARITPNQVRRETAAVMIRFRRSLIDMPSREKEGHDYFPQPLDTGAIELGSLEYLSEMLAENCHDIWALERVKQGWSFGLVRDDTVRHHPNLVPYHKLPKEEQAFDYRTSMETLKTIMSLNFQIVRNAQIPNYLRNTNRTMSSSSTSGIVTNVSPAASNHAMANSAAVSASKSGPTTTSSASNSVLCQSASFSHPSAFALTPKTSSGISTPSTTTSGVSTTLSPKSNISPSMMSSPSPTIPPLPSSTSSVTWSKRQYSSSSSTLSAAAEELFHSPYFVELEDGEVYYPRPIDTSHVELPIRLTQLVDLLAENAHEVWSKGRMDSGWVYGPVRDDVGKKHPCLVPFVFLTEEEKDYDVHTAMGTLKMLLAMGFNVVDKESKWVQ